MARKIETEHLAAIRFAWKEQLKDKGINLVVKKRRFK